MKTVDKDSVFSRIRAALSIPHLYEVFSETLIGGRRDYVKNYIRPREGDAILDIGCGTGSIVPYLPDSAQYSGFDLNQKYIQFAQKKYRSRRNVTFECKDVNVNNTLKSAHFDIVMVNGVLHHLEDEEANRLFELAVSTIKPSGRLVTLDGCYTDRQSGIARYLVARDRGKYVRTQEAYMKLALPYFKSVKVHIRHDMLSIPYTIIIMECSVS